jgi:hypothetical protein
MKTYFFWLESGIFIGEDVMSLLVGCVVAMAAKGKEMAATMTLGFLATLIHAGIAVSVAKHAHADAFALLRLFPVRLFASAILVVIGGVIVREIRFAAARRLSRA